MRKSRISYRADTAFNLGICLAIIIIRKPIYLYNGHVWSHEQGKFLVG